MTQPTTPEPNKSLRRMGEFYRNVGEILATFADIVQPRSFDELERHGFADAPN